MDVPVYVYVCVVVYVYVYVSMVYNNVYPMLLVLVMQ